MEISCAECGEDFEVNEEQVNCPNCGFGPENCSHPMSYRDSETIYSVDEGKYIERVICSKCGSSLT